MSTSVARAPRTEVRSAASWGFLIIAAAFNYLTTRIGVQTGHIDLNSAGVMILEHAGTAGLILVLKLPAVLFVGGLWLLLPVRYRDLGVLIVALVWVSIAAWNAFSIVGVI